MKKLTLLAFAALCIVNVFATKIRVSGNITGNTAPTFKNVQLFYQGNVAKSDLKDGKFDLEIDIDRDGFVELYLNSTNFFVYASPKEDLNLDIVVNTMNDYSITSTNKKDYANQFLADMHKIALSMKQTGFYTDKFKDASNAAKKFIGKVEPLKKEKLAKVTKKYPEFGKNLEHMFHYMFTFANATNLSTKEITKELEDLKNSGYSIHEISVPYFRNYFEDLLKIKVADKLALYGIDYDAQKDANLVNTVYAEYLVEYSPGQSFTNFMFFKPVSQELMLNGAKNQNYLEFIFANVNSKSYDSFKKDYEAKLAAIKEIESKGVEKAFNFEFLDKDGKTYRLDDFKGKMLLIDCWASWCGPCRGQIPALKSLEEKYKGKDINFLSVSLDNSKKAWLKAVDEEGLHGYVLHAPGAFKNEFAKHYGINSIPRFLLIDANGNVINDDMPKPSEEEVVRNIIDVRLYDNKVKEIIESHKNALHVDQLKGKMFHVKESSSVMGLVNNSDVYATLDNTKKSVSTPGNPELMKQFFGPAGADPTITLLKDGISYSKGEEKPEEGTPSLYGYELVYLANAGAKFTMNKETFDNEDNCYVLDCNFKGKEVTYYISKETNLLKKSVSRIDAGRRSGGGKFTMTFSYDNYDNVSGQIYLKKYSMNGMFTIVVSEFEIIDENRNLFKL